MALIQTDQCEVMVERRRSKQSILPFPSIQPTPCYFIKIPKSTPSQPAHTQNSQQFIIRHTIPTCWQPNPLLCRGPHYSSYRLRRRFPPLLTQPLILPQKPRQSPQPPHHRY